MRNTADVTGGKYIAVQSRSISGVSAVNPLVAFYDIRGRNEKVLFFCFVPAPHETKIFLQLVIISVPPLRIYTIRLALFITSVPPRLRTGAMLILKLLHYIMRVIIHKNLPLQSLCELNKTASKSVLKI
jgi:hypothetical protein